MALYTSAAESAVKSGEQFPFAEQDKPQAAVQPPPAHVAHYQVWTMEARTFRASCVLHILAPACNTPGEFAELPAPSCADSFKIYSMTRHVSSAGDWN